MALMADGGEQITPFASGPSVQALKLALVRAEFIKSWPAEGETERQRQQAKATACRRAVESAVDKGLVVVRDVGGEDFIWLAGATEAAPTAGKTNGGSEPVAPITLDERDALKVRGFSNEAVLGMTPQHARAILADESRNRDTERFRVVGEVTRSATCVKCGEPGGVRLIRDTRSPGSKPMPLHLRCAGDWFDNEDAPL